MSEEQNKAPNEGEARVLSDDELKGIVGGGVAAAKIVNPSQPVGSSTVSSSGLEVKSELQWQ